MRKSRVEAEATRERIVATAARLFRKHGISGVGIAELMKQAGLTHGGFYKHFPSKEALVAEACNHALDEARSELAKDAARAAPGESLEALISSYLSTTHRDRPEQGCAIVALAGETVRDEGPSRQVMAAGADKLVELVATQLNAATPAEARSDARGVVAAMVGGLLMARAAEDPVLSAAYLKDVQAFILRGVGGRGNT